MRTLSRAAAARDRLVTSRMSRRLVAQGFAQVLHNDSSLSSDESGRDFINYINQVYDINTPPPTPDGLDCIGHQWDVHASTVSLPSSLS